MGCGPQLSAAQKRKEAAAAASAHGRVGLRPKKEEGAGRPAGALLDWARRKGNRPSGPEARQREGEGFTFF